MQAMRREGGQVPGLPTRRGLAVVILAAGQGTRMRSRRSKVLHEIAGRPMLAYPLAAAERLGGERLVVVVGRDAHEVQECFAGRAEFALQAERRGTGHAVLQAAPKLRDFRGEILILYGDTPLLRTESLEQMIELKRAAEVGLVMLSARAPLPGRVVRDARGQVARIVETTDATPEELAIEEGNTGVYLIDSDLLWEALDQVGDDNEQGEIYLTDVVAYAVSQGRGVEALVLADAEESLGVNDRAELALAAAVVRRRVAARWMVEGVTLVDPETTYIDVDAVIGQDSVLEPGCVVQGASEIGSGVRVRAGCVIEASHVGEGADIGPHLYLAPGSRVAAGTRLAPAGASRRRTPKAGAAARSGRPRAAGGSKAATASRRAGKGSSGAKARSRKKAGATGKSRTRKPRR